MAFSRVSLASFAGALEITFPNPDAYLWLTNSLTFSRNFWFSAFEFCNSFEKVSASTVLFCNYFWIKLISLDCSRIWVYFNVFCNFWSCFLVLDSSSSKLTFPCCSFMNSVSILKKFSFIFRSSRFFFLYAFNIYWVSSKVVIGKDCTLSGGPAIWLSCMKVSTYFWPSSWFLCFRRVYKGDAGWALYSD